MVGILRGLALATQTQAAVQRHVLGLLTQGTLDACKEIFWSVLELDRVDQPLPTDRYSPAFAASVDRFWVFAERGDFRVYRARLRPSVKIEPTTMRSIVQPIARATLTFVLLASDATESSWAVVVPEPTHSGLSLRYLPLTSEQHRGRAAEVLAEIVTAKGGDYDGQGSWLPLWEQVGRAFADVDELGEIEAELRAAERGTSEYPVDRLWRRFRTHILTADQEYALFEQLVLAEGDGRRELRSQRKTAAVLDRLAHHNLGLAIWQAWRSRRKLTASFDLMDAVQEGLCGLLRAFETFDHERGGKLSTYAVWWIRQMIVRAAANDGRTIRLPVHLVDSYAPIARSIAVYRGKHGTSPSNDDVSRDTGIPSPAVAKLRLADLVSRPLPLEWAPAAGQAALLDPSLADRPWEFLEDEWQTYLPKWARADEWEVSEGGAAKEDGTPLVDLLPDDAMSVEDTVIGQWDSYAIESAMEEALTRREQRVVKLRFGLHGGQPHTLDAIGLKYGLTRERIRQIEAKALAKLRPKMESQGYMPTLLANSGMESELHI